MGSTTVARGTAEEHEMINDAQHRLEVALVRAGSGGQRNWSSRLARESRRLLELLQSHVESAEGPEGLLTEIEKRMLAINDQVVSVLKDHRRLVDECGALVSKASLCSDGRKDYLPDLRKSAASLMTEIRRHLALEADLITEMFACDGRQAD